MSPASKAAAGGGGGSGGGGGGGGWDLTSNFSHSRSVPCMGGAAASEWDPKSDQRMGDQEGWEVWVWAKSLFKIVGRGGKAGPVSNWDSGSPCQQALPTFSTIFEQGGLCLCFVICTFAITAPPQLRPPSPFLSDFFPLS